MTEIGFYHLLRTPLEAALPQLLARTLERGERAVVKAGSEERVKQLDDALWRWGPSNRNDSFLPHGTAADGNAEKQPVWLTAGDDNPNRAAFLFLTDGAASDALGDYTPLLHPVRWPRRGGRGPGPHAVEGLEGRRPQPDLLAAGRPRLGEEGLEASAIPSHGRARGRFLYPAALPRTPTHRLFTDGAAAPWPSNGPSRSSSPTPRRAT